MKVNSFLAAISILFTITAANAQQSPATGWSIGTATAGIGFGEFRRYSGIRLNSQNTDSSVINGIDLTLCGLMQHSHSSIVNGLSIGITNTYNARTTGISYGFADMTDTVNGFSIGPLMAGGTVRNGVTIGGILAGAYHTCGATIAPFCGGARLTGGSAAVLNAYGQTTGVLIAVVNADIAPDSLTDGLTGLELGIYNTISKCRGVQIGLVNTTTELHGIQIGLLNKADNAFLQYLPFVNLKFD